MLKKKKSVALVLALVMALFCLTACGSKEERDDRLVGEWVTTQSDSVEGFEVVIEGRMSLNDDGSMKLISTVDAALLRQVGGQIYDQLLDGQPAEVVEEFLKEAGVASREAWVDDFYATIQESLDEGALEGYWTTEDSSLITYETKEDYEKDVRGEDHTEPYSMSEDGLTLELLPSEDEEGMTFTKVQK